MDFVALIFPFTSKVYAGVAVAIPILLLVESQTRLELSWVSRPEVPM